MSVHPFPASESLPCEWEQQNWIAFKAGDRHAFHCLYERYFGVLLNYGRKFTSARPLVEDAVQGLFVDIWKSREQLATPPSVRNYLLKAFRNRLVREIQKQSGSVEVNDDYIVFEAKIAQDHLILAEDISRTSRYLQEKLDSLSNRQREAVYLIFYQELNYEEAAQVMSLKIRTVYNLVHIAITTLRKQVKREEFVYPIFWLLLLLLLQ